jgi:hypothetical protein
VGCLFLTQTVNLLESNTEEVKVVNLIKTWWASVVEMNPVTALVQPVTLE